jgi:hypothetical protein
MALPYSPTEVGLPLTLRTERLPEPNARLETTGGRPIRSPGARLARRSQTGGSSIGATSAVFASLEVRVGGGQDRAEKEPYRMGGVVARGYGELANPPQSGALSAAGTA